MRICILKKNLYSVFQQSNVYMLIDLKHMPVHDCWCCEQPYWLDVTCWTRGKEDLATFPSRNSKLRVKCFLGFPRQWSGLFAMQQCFSVSSSGSKISAFMLMLQSTWSCLPSRQISHQCDLGCRWKMVSKLTVDYLWMLDFFLHVFPLYL